MTAQQPQDLDTTPTWISTVLWLGVSIVVISFLALIGVLVYYFAGVTPATWLFWLALFAFPTGFILLLVALLGNIWVRRKHQRA
jgi:FtsH-binding integral membrane protein